MHEFLLFSQIPATRHSQVLNILAGVTGAQPTRYSDQHLIFAQLQDPKSTASKRQSPKQAQQTQGRSYQCLIRSISATATAAGPWTLRTEQTPEPGNQTAISRSATETPLIDSSALDRLHDQTAYRFAGQYIATGHRFVYSNVIIRICRILTCPNADQSAPLEASPPTVEELKPLDGSGAYVVEACIRLEDRTDSALSEGAVKELQDFKKLLDGAVDFRVPDRLALDTRVKE